MPSTNRRRIFTVTDAKDLYSKSCKHLNEARSLLAEARDIATRSGTGLSIDSSVLDSSYQSPFLPTRFSHGTANDTVVAPAGTGAGNNNNNANANGNKPADAKTAPAIHNASAARSSTLNAFPPILSTTGGHSNTDHIIQVTGDHRADTIAEYKRKLKRRARAMQPEQRGTDRWDQPRVSGSRRRRIAREKDLPSAPPEPPPSGYVLFIAQMTTKIRHDRPNAHHNQIKVVREISKIWKFGMNDQDREYYNEFAREARDEYDRQHHEFRATGAYKPSLIFERLGGDGPWVRIAFHEKNALEREISGYETVKFPPRPEHAEVPGWVTKVEKQNEREASRRLEREERLKKQREEDIRLLKEASEAKMRRLQEADKYK